MAIDTEQKRATSLLDQPALFPDAVLTTATDRAQMLEEYFAGPVSFPSHAITVRQYVQCAFFSNPGDTFYNYVDITPYARDEGTALTSRRGRQAITQKFNTGTGTFVLDNRQLNFEALNPNGPYYGNLLVDRPVQAGFETPWLPGLLANGAFPNDVAGWTAAGATLAWAASVFGDISGHCRVTSIGTSAITVTSPFVSVVTPMLSRFAAASVRVGRVGSQMPPYATLAINYYSDLSGVTPNGSYSTSVQGVDTWVSDNFGRTDSAVSLGSPDNGAVWQPIIGTWGVSGGKGYCAVTDASLRNVAVLQTNRKDCELQLTLSTVGVFSGIAFRLVDSGNYFVFACEAGSDYALQKVTAGTITTLASGGSAPVNGDVLKVRLSGSRIQCFVNGTLVINVSNSSFQTSTLHGLGVNSNNITARFDNFTVTSPQARVSIADPSHVPAGTQSMRLAVTFTTPIVNGEVDDIQAAVLDTLLSSAMAGMDPFFTGYADGWDCQWDVGDNLCTLSASDAMKALALAGLNTTLYGDYLRTLGAAKWYRMGETVLSQYNVLGLAFKDEVTGSYDASVAKTSPGSSTPPYRNRGPLAGIAGCSPVDPDFGFSLVGPSSQDGGAVNLGGGFSPSTQEWSVALWLRSTDGVLPAVADGRTGTQAAWNLLALGYPFIGGGGCHTSLWINNLGQVQTMAFDSYYNDAARHGSGQATLWDGATNGADNTGQDIVVDTLWHRVWIVYDGSTNTLQVYVDGLLDHTEAQFSGGTGFTFASSFTPFLYRRLGAYYTANAENVNAGYPPKFEVDEVMLFNSAVSAGTISTDYLRGRLTYPAQRSDERVSAVLDNVPWPSSRRVIDTNQGVTVTAQVAAISRGNPVSYLQTVEDTEVGMFFVDASGNVQWVSAASLEDATKPYSLAQFVFGGSEIPYESVATSNNDKLVYTAAQVSIEGGSVQVVDSGDSQWWNRTFPKQGLLLDTNQKADEVAAWWAAVLSSENTRLDGMVVDPLASEAALQAVQAMEVGMAVEVRLRPPGIAAGTYFAVVAQIQGINVTGSRNRIRVAYSLSSVYTQRWYQFGDAFSSYSMAL